MISTTRVMAIANGVLAACLAEYTTAGLSAPERAYVTTAVNVAEDCGDQLVVQVQSLAAMDTANLTAPQRDGNPIGLWQPSATIAVLHSRCVPTVSHIGETVVFPSNAAESAAAASIVADSTAICAAILGCRGTVFPERMLRIDRWEASPFGGGIGGGRWTFTVGLVERA